MTLFLDVAGNADAAERFWSQVTGTRLSSRRGPDGEFVTLLPAQGDAHLRVQRVGEGNGGCHLDLHVVRDAIDDAADRAVAFGARRRHREEGEVTVLESPGGFPFCVVSWDGEQTNSEPVDGARLDQLCIDAPADRFDADYSFWANLTGWEPRAGSRPEFRSLNRPAAMPVRLLFQRLEPDGGAVAGHPDFACDDRDGLTARHTAAGARVVATFPRWTTLADTGGRLYCLTDRDPSIQPAAGR